MEIIWIRTVFDRSAACFMSHFFVRACILVWWQEPGQHKVIIRH